MVVFSETCIYKFCKVYKLLFKSICANEVWWFCELTGGDPRPALKRIGNSLVDYLAVYV